MDQLDQLSTIEHALSRKRAALRSLSLRVHSRAAPAGKPVPSSDAARLAILQREVNSLERSREEALLTLASSATRQQRMHQAGRIPLPSHDSPSQARPHQAVGPPPAARPTSSSPGPWEPIGPPPAARPTSSPATRDEAPPPPPHLAAEAAEAAFAGSIDVTDDAPEAEWAWKAYRTAQKQRDSALRDSLKTSWKVHGAELATMRQEATPRVDSGEVNRPPSPAKAKTAPVDAVVRKSRRDGRHLNRELTDQRRREWAARGDFLRQVREQTGKRIDDRHDATVLSARPLYGFTASAATSSPSMMRHVLSNEGLSHDAAAAPFPPRSKPPAHGEWQTYRDDEGDEHEIGYAGTVYTNKLYTYDDGATYRLGPGDDPFQFPYASGSPPKPAQMRVGREGSMRAASARPATYEAMRAMLRSPRR